MLRPSKQRIIWKDNTFYSLRKLCIGSEKPFYGEQERSYSRVQSGLLGG